MLVFERMMNAKTINPQESDQSAIITGSPYRQLWNGHWQPTASRDHATAFWFALAVHTRLARCHHKSSCASTTPRTVSKPQRKPKIPWRARCFSGMRWSGCATGLQHPSNRSCVVFVDARQPRDRAWYIEAIYDPLLLTTAVSAFCACNARCARWRPLTDIEIDGEHQCLMNLTPST
jgi:hypothetical protein